MSNNFNAKDNVGSDASNEVEHRHQRHPGCPVCEYNHDHDYHYNPDPDYMWDALCVNVNTLVSVQAQRSTSNCQPHSPPHSVEPQCGSYMGPKLLTSDSYVTQILGPQRMTSSLSSGGCQSLR